MQLQLSKDITKTQGDPLLYKIDNTTEYLNAEFLIDFHNQRDTFTMKAISKPEDAMAIRNKARTELTADGSAIDVYFKKRMQELLNMGLPQEKARAMALKSTEYLYDDAMEMLDARYPGLFKGTETAVIDRDAMFARNNVAGTGVNAELASEYKLRKRGQLALKGK